MIAHISNTRAVRISKLINDIDLGIRKYDLSEVLINSKDSDSNPENIGADIEPILV